MILDTRYPQNPLFRVLGDFLFFAILIASKLQKVVYTALYKQITKQGYKMAMFRIMKSKGHSSAMSGAFYCKLCTFVAADNQGR